MSKRYIPKNLHLIKYRIDTLAKYHGSLRAAARVLNLTPAYLCRLRSGVKTSPSDRVLSKLGLRRDIYIVPSDSHWEYPIGL